MFLLHLSILLLIIRVCTQVIVIVFLILQNGKVAPNGDSPTGEFLAVAYTVYQACIVPIIVRHSSCFTDVPPSPHVYDTHAGDIPHGHHSRRRMEQIGP